MEDATIQDHTDPEPTTSPATGSPKEQVHRAAAIVDVVIDAYCPRDNNGEFETRLRKCLLNGILMFTLDVEEEYRGVASE